MEVVYMSKVGKTGSSHTIVLPVAIMRALEISRGDYMAFAIYTENRLVARKITPDELKQLKPLPTID